MKKIYCKKCIYFYYAVSYMYLGDATCSREIINKYNTKIDKTITLYENRKGTCKYYEEIKPKKRWWKR